MNLSENIIVDRSYRIFELVWRGFYFRDRSTFRKATKKRYEKHADKCFYHAHRLFRKHNKENNLGWENWEISIVRPCQNSNFYLKQCTFKITKINKELI